MNSIAKPQKGLFSNRDLAVLIIPLIIEQVLTMVVGFVDTVMVSSVSEAAVSGVALIDVFVVLFNNVFAALATGGAVVAGQAIGRKEPETAGHAANQLLVMATAVGVCIAVVLFAIRGWMISTLFGTIEPDVWQNAMDYITITLFSVPAMAMLNACAALFRTEGDSRTPMMISLLMNAINVCGNALLIYVFHWGVSGAAIASVMARIIMAGVAYYVLSHRVCILRVSFSQMRTIDFSMQRRILRIALPNSVENSLFQLGKIMMVGMIATFGTAQIAANSVSNAVAGFQCVSGLACGTAMIPVVSRCVGAGEYEQVRYYTIKLLKITTIGMIVVNVPMLFFLDNIVGLYSTLSAEAVQYAIMILTMHGVCCMIHWSFAFSLPNALRAAGDVRYCMVISIAVMVFVRLIGGVSLAKYCGLMTLGVWIATVLDWVVRAGLLWHRFRGTKWQGRQA